MYDDYKQIKIKAASANLIELNQLKAAKASTCIILIIIKKWKQIEICISSYQKQKIFKKQH